MRSALAVVGVLAACGGDPDPTPVPLFVPVAVTIPVPAAPEPAPATPAPDDCNVRATVEHFANKTTRFWLDDEHAARVQAALVEATTQSLAVTDVVADDARALSARVTAALKAHDYAALAKLVAPGGLCLRAAKGAACRWMDPKELARCGHGRTEAWAVDSGSDQPTRLDCADAFAHIFYDRDYAKATPKVNCFPEPGRGNNSASIMTDEVKTVVYVELYDEDDRGMWGALWLHLAYDDVDLRLVGLTSEYWGI